MIRAFRDWRAYRRLRAQWSYDVADEMWTRDGWAIDLVRGHEYPDGTFGPDFYCARRIDYWHGLSFPTLREAMEYCSRIDAARPRPEIVFRPGHVRDTAAAMLPDGEDA